MSMKKYIMFWSDTEQVQAAIAAGNVTRAMQRGSDWVSVELSENGDPHMDLDKVAGPRVLRAAADCWCPCHKGGSTHFVPCCDGMIEK